MQSFGYCSSQSFISSPFLGGCKNLSRNGTDVIRENVIFEKQYSIGQHAPCSWHTNTLISFFPPPLQEGDRNSETFGTTAMRMTRGEKKYYMNFMKIKGYYFMFQCFVDLPLFSLTNCTLLGTERTSEVK